MKAGWYAATALLIAVAMLRVAATHRVFSPTSDELVHIAAGLRWLDLGDCAFDIEHPPLSRAIAAIPFWIGRVPLPSGAWNAQGNAILGWRGDYIGNLARARRGNLLFLAVGMIVVALWTRRAFGNAAAICATAMMAVLPPILGNAGFATTDMAVAAMLPAALYATSRWMDAPSWPRAIVAGVAVGLGLLSKFSFVIFFPAGLLVLWLVRRKRPAANGIAALLIALVIVWAAYRFDFESMRRAHPMGAQMVSLAYRGPLSYLMPDWIADVPAPAPLFTLGVLEVKFHNDRGHGSFLFGRYSRFGWWYYFPVVLFFKTPIAFLILASYGIAIAWRRARELALLPLTVLLPAMASTIDIGVRHILPIYPLLAIVAGAALVAIWNRWRVVAVLVAGWLLIVTTLAHPDYFAWFNEAAGSHPERIVVDSDIDWGQDVFRLADVCRQHHIDHIGVALFAPADYDRAGLPPRAEVTPATLPHGWVAIGELMYWSESFHALDSVPYERVGKSIRLYHLR